MSDIPCKRGNSGTLDELIIFIWVYMYQLAITIARFCYGTANIFLKWYKMVWIDFLMKQ